MLVLEMGNSFCIILFILVEFMLSALHRQQRDVSQKPDDKILLTESIQITDKFGFNREDANALNSGEHHEKIYPGMTGMTCLNGYGKLSKTIKNRILRNFLQKSKFFENFL